MMKRCSPSDCSSPVGLGYTKINLPLLRRCISDPTLSSPDLNNSSSPSPTRCGFNSSLPPRAPPTSSLRRSVSDLNPSPPANSSPNSKRLKRMKGRLKEMSEWCMQLMQEEEEGEGEDDDEEQRKNEGPTTPDVPNDTSTEGSSEKEFSESVSVEKKDDSLVINFRCHCNKACQFLLNGTDCYYKVL